MATVRQFDVGDAIVATTIIRGPDRELLDPEEVVLMLRAPDGVEETIAATRTEAGHYEVTWRATKAGTWYRRWKALNAEGESLGADEAAIVIERSAFAEP